MNRILPLNNLPVNYSPALSNLTGKLFSGFIKPKTKP